MLIMEFDKLVVGFLVDEVVGGFFISVPPGHIACIYDRGRGVLKRVLGPGLHLKIPFWQIAKLFNAQILEYTITENFDLNHREALGDVPIKTTTKDGFHIQVEASILFRLDKSNAPELWENIGENFVSKVVRPISRSRMSAIFASLTLDQIKNSRTQIEALLKDELNSHFQPKGILCEGALLSEVKLAQAQGNAPEVIFDRDQQHPPLN